MEATKNTQVYLGKETGRRLLTRLESKKDWVRSVPVVTCSSSRSSTPVMWLRIGQISSAGLSALEDRNDARGRRIENLKGISSLSPGLRGTSYPG